MGEFRRKLADGDQDYYDHIEKLHNSFEIDQFEDFWELLNQIPGNDLFIVAIKQISLGRLASLGMTDHSIELASETFGPGRNYNIALKSKKIADIEEIEFLAAVYPAQLKKKAVPAAGFPIGQHAQTAS